MTPPSTSSISTPTSARPNSLPTPGSTSSAGTAPSASWTGFEGDERLCADLERTHGVAATTAVLAINELLEIQKVRRFALVSPYVGAVQRRIIETYGDAGYECVAERRFEERVNYAFAEIEDVRIAEAVRQVSTARPEAVVVMCTNLRSAHLVAALEAELGIPVLDSVAAFVWKAVRLCGIDYPGHHRLGAIVRSGRFVACGARPTVRRRVTGRMEHVRRIEGLIRHVEAHCRNR